MQENKIEDTVVILFPGGTYGKYLYWVLNNFTSRGLQNDTIYKPLSNGSAHKQSVNELTPDYTNCDRSQWEIYKSKKQFIPYFARHIIEDSTDFNADQYIELNDVAGTVNKVILIQSDNHLMNLNNVFEKTFNNPMDYYRRQNRFPDFKININNLSEVRELFSYKLFYFETREPIIHNHQNVLDINLDDLLFSFKDTLTEILWFLDTELTVSMDVLLANHKKMLSLQKHLHKDHNIKVFLENFEQEKGCSLPDNCTIIDEAYIQKYLRDELNLEIKCHGLINFPKTTTELKQLTYPAEELQCNLRSP